MDFHLQLDPVPLENKIKAHDKIILIGSCFTEHMHEKLKKYKFKALQNPNGILFNPLSISQAIEFYLKNKSIHEGELFLKNGLWNHWQFHSSLSSSEKDSALKIMNSNIESSHQFLCSAKWLIITFGSSIVYELHDGKVVANCHKAPMDMFTRRMLTLDEIIQTYSKTINEIRTFNPSINIIFTVSPVRHLKEGFVENNRSKSTLILAIAKLIEEFDHCFYFPSYELIIDDLRDYRFYAEDMVHPNYLATNYVWEKFSLACIDGKTRQVFKELDFINNALNHRPLHPESEEHKKFRAKIYTSIQELVNRFPEFDLKSELEFFKD